jgi:hypothetical protein
MQELKKCDEKPVWAAGSYAKPPNNRDN